MDDYSGNLLTTLQICRVPYFLTSLDFKFHMPTAQDIQGWHLSFQDFREKKNLYS